MDTMTAITAEPTDRGAVLREAADEIEARQARLDAEELDEIGSLDHETVLQGAAVRDMATHLRRVADETPQPSVHDYTGAPTP
jgi:acyl-CoA reductase-like NAD-dependent aldehyde dehydrogenase